LEPIFFLNLCKPLAAVPASLQCHFSLCDSERSRQRPTVSYNSFYILFYFIHCTCARAVTESISHRPIFDVQCFVQFQSSRGTMPDPSWVENRGQKCSKRSAGTL